MVINFYLLTRRITQGLYSRSPCKFLFPKPPAVENWPILGHVLLSSPDPILITFLSWVLPVDRGTRKTASDAKE
jgi:hypothetical protein